MWSEGRPQPRARAPEARRSVAGHVVSPCGVTPEGRGRGGLRWREVLPPGGPSPAPLAFARHGKRTACTDRGGCPMALRAQERRGSAVFGCSEHTQAGLSIAAVRGGCVACPWLWRVHPPP
eukprot:scaffold318_cov396-Prasinococcus_capsulatus_cf.AAC.19